MWLSKTPTMPLYAARPLATLPQTATRPLFVVTGKILLTHLVGEVTTVMQALANATKLIQTPNVGAASDLCATNDLTGDVLASYYTITGTIATAMVNVSTAPAIKLATPIVINAGTIDLVCAGSATGAIKWSLVYIQLEPNSSVQPV